MVGQLEQLAADLVDELERWIPSALEGKDEAVRAYVRAWRLLSRRILELAHDALPTAVVSTADGSLQLVDRDGQAAPVGSDLLGYLALNAPFSPWVTRFGPGPGAALFLLSEIRAAIPGLEAISFPRGEASLAHWDVDRWDFARFARCVWLELVEDESALERIAGTFDLTQTDLGRLFGVRRQAIAQWIHEGIPPARQPKVLTVARIAELLERNLIAERIPAIARTPARAYGELTMLQMIEQDRHEELLERVQRSFDWAWTA